MRKRTLKFTLPIILGLMVAITSCEKPEQPEEKNNNATSTATVVMDSVTVSSTLDSISNSTGTLYFTRLPGVDTLKVGNIICSVPTNVAPNGFFYKIKKITRNGEHTIIETDEASLEEAIPDGELNTTINLSDYIEAIYDENGEKIDYEIVTQSNQLRASVSVAVVIPIYKHLLSLEGGQGDISGKVDITLKGSLTLTNDLDINVSIKNHTGHIESKTESDLHVTLSGEVDGKVQLLKKEMYRIKIKPIVKMIGWFPLVITRDIPIDLKIDLAGKMQASIEAENISSSALGVAYENDKIEPIRECQSTNTHNQKIVLSGEYKVTVEPQWRLSFYGLEDYNALETFLGLYLKGVLSQDIVNSANSSSRYGLNPELTVSWGVDAGVRAKLRIFSLKLGTTFIEGNLYKKDLFKWSVFPQWKAMEIKNKTTTSADASTTVASAPYGNATIFPVWQYGIVVSKNPLPNIRDDSYNNMGALPDYWTAENSPIAAWNLTNLEQNTTYYVCPYFVNWFGDFYGNVTIFTTKQEDPVPESVVINGVRWATRNVGAQTPEDFGNYYQWNRGRTDFLSYEDYFNDTISNATSWLPVNDPCPNGWRVPTAVEIYSLIASQITNKWTVQNGIDGESFTDNTTGASIFLPAAGFRENNSTLNYAGNNGYYWNSTKPGSASYYLYFNRDVVWQATTDILVLGMSVRCVAE